MVFRLHRIHCIRCGLLLRMSHVAWSVCLSVSDCVSVCWSHRCLCKNGCTDLDAMWGLTLVDQHNLLPSAGWEVNAGQRAVAVLCSRKGNRRSGVALALGDEHPAYSPVRSMAFSSPPWIRPR